MKTAKLTPEDCLYVCQRLRELDRVEVFATMWSDEPADMAAVTMALAGDMAWCASKDGEPVMVLGAAQAWPGFWSVYAFGTDRVPEIGLSVTRFVKKVIFPAMKAAGWRRAECRSMDGHTDAHKWLEALGGQRDPNPITRFGKNGETFHSFVFYPENC